MNANIKWLSFVLLFFSYTAIAQTTNRWVGGATGNWNTAANWSLNAVPSIAHKVLINSTANITCDFASGLTIGQLEISGTGTVATLISNFDSKSLTIGNGYAGDDLFVAAGNTLTFGATANSLELQITVATQNTGLIQGSVVFGGSTFTSQAHRIISPDARGVIFASGSTFTADLNTNGNPFGTVAAPTYDNIVFQAGANFIFKAGSNPFGATAPGSVVKFETGSWYRHQSTAAPAVSGRIYANIEFDANATTSLSAGAGFTADTVAVKQGVVRLGTAGSSNSVYNIKAMLNVMAGATANLGGVASGTNVNTTTINFQGTNASIIGAGTLIIESTATSSSTINIAAGSNYTLNRAFDVTGSPTTTKRVNIFGTLTVGTGGTYTTVDDVTTIKSTATATGAIGNTTGTITGPFVVERFVPAKVVRKSVLMASAVTARIDTSWQRQIHITGAVGVCPSVGTTGFDLTQTGNPSMFTYSASMQAGQRWVPIANTNATTLTPGVGYRVMVRGDRTRGCTLLDGTNDSTIAVTVSARGALAQGSVDRTVVQGFTLVGNPYPSPINFNLLATANNNIDASYWAYNPENNNGIYSVFNNGTLTNKPSGYTNDNIIASGQAFFVRKQSVGVGTITFQEAHKATTAQPGLFRTQNWLGMTRIALRANNDAHLDEAVIRFSNEPSVSNTNEGPLDALSINEGTQMISSVKAGNLYSIQTRTAVTTADTVSLHVVSNNNGSYKLYFGELQIGSNNAILIDKFLNQQQAITEGDSYNFTTTSDPATKGQRFTIVFRSSATLPTNFTAIYAKAKEGNKAADVLWTVASDKQVVQYQVERSTDGRSYKAVGIVASQQSNQTVSYSYTDNQAISTVVYYRVKATAADGSYKYSAVAKLNGKTSSIELSLYPNPVQSQLQVQLSQPVKGQLTARMVDSKGQVVYQQSSINMAGSNLLQLSVAHLPQGTYQLTLTNGSDFTATGNFVK